MLEGEGWRAVVAKGVEPGPDRVGVAVEGGGHLGGGPVLGQEPQGMPAFAFAGGGRTIHVLAHLAQVQVPAAQQGEDLVHRRA